MAKVKQFNTKYRRLTLTWKDGEYTEQEEILAQHQKSGEATHLLMDALAKIHKLLTIDELKRIDVLIDRLSDDARSYPERIRETSLTTREGLTKLKEGGSV
jgi:hypothetical protein